MTQHQVVGANIDTWLINVKGKLPDGLAEELDFLKEASQEADEDIPTRWTFAGETLFIRAHGSGRQWRWILHCPSLHLDIGRGKLNHIIGKARLVCSVSVGARGGGCAASALHVPGRLLWRWLHAPGERGPSVRRHRGLGALPRRCARLHHPWPSAQDAHRRRGCEDEAKRSRFVRPSLELNMTGQTLHGV